MQPPSWSATNPNTNRRLTYRDPLRYRATPPNASRRTYHSATCTSAQHMPFVLEGATYYTAADVARDVGVSRQTLWRWRQDGKIPLGRRYRDRQVVFTPEELRAVREFAHRLEPIDGPSPDQLKLFGGRRT